jgi:ParB family transcriptional regulator, chromosome partitioning protein
VSKKGLGRGLEALLPEIELLDEDRIVEIPLEDIVPNPYQPRKTFDDTKITELAMSIKEYGVLQPIILRRGEANYQLVAGERRFRAAKEAGLSTIPAVIREIQEERLMEIALIENLQRENLNPMDEAFAYDRLMKNSGMTQDQLSDRLGISRSQIANYVRLLHLSDEAKSLLAEGQISVGHAKVLASLANENDQTDLVRIIVREQLSVRQTEELARQNEQKVSKKARRSKTSLSPEIESLEDALKVRLGAMVKLSFSNGKGRIEIPFSSEEELERIADLLFDDKGVPRADQENKKETRFVV